MPRTLFTAAALVLALAHSSLAQNAYIPNSGSNTVSVIDTATDNVIATIPVGNQPVGVAVTRDGSKVHITNENANSQGSVSVIDTGTNTVTATIPVGIGPIGVAVSPDDSRIYVTHVNSITMSVIDAATNTVTATIPVGSAGGDSPLGVAVTPDNSKVFVARGNAETVSVIDTATNTVIADIRVGVRPVAFGNFIQPAKPAPKFAGTPGHSNCYGKSISALGGLNNAAAALGFDSVSALQNAIVAFCGG